MDAVAHSADIVITGVCWFVKAGIGSIVLLLLFSPLQYRIMAYGQGEKYKMIGVVTSFVVRPVSSALPEKLRMQPYDLAPLVASILLLIMGFGMCALADLFSAGLTSLF